MISGENNVLFTKNQVTTCCKNTGWRNNKRLNGKRIRRSLLNLRDWVKEYEKDGANAFPGSGNLKPEDEEIRRLCREVANLKEENEMLRLFS